MIDNKIYLKVDDHYLDCISRFRTSIDQMSTSFTDLLYFHRDDFIKSFKNIVTINQEFIHRLITLPSLTHEDQFQEIDKYYELKDSQNKEIRSLLEDVKRDIESSFNNFYESERSPISDSMKNKYSEKKFNLLKKYLEESRESINTDDEMMIYDDFIESKIIPLFKGDNYDPYNDNDDDDDSDDDDNNNKRYYGNPYIYVPIDVQKSINEYLAFANSIISINAILNFEKVKQKYSKKAEDSKEKIRKENIEEQKRIKQEKENEKIRERERLKEQEKQKLLDLDVPELQELIDSLKSKKKDLEDEISDLSDKKETLEDEISNLSDKKEELEGEVSDLSDKKEELESEGHDLELGAPSSEEKNKEESKDNLANNKEKDKLIADLKAQLAKEKEEREKSQIQVEKLLSKLSTLKILFDSLKRMK